MFNQKHLLQKKSNTKLDKQYQEKTSIPQEVKLGGAGSPLNCGIRECFYHYFSSSASQMRLVGVAARAVEAVRHVLAINIKDGVAGGSVLIH